MTALAGAATPMSREHAGLWGGGTARSYLHAPNPYPTLGHCGKSPLFGAGQKRARLFDLVRFVIPFHTQYYSCHFGTFPRCRGRARNTPTSEHARARRARARGPGRPPPPGPRAPLGSDADALVAGRLLLVFLLLEVLLHALLLELVQPLQLVLAEEQLCAGEERAPVSRARAPGPRPPHPPRPVTQRGLEGCPLEQSGSLNPQGKITAVRDVEPNTVSLENFCTYFVAGVKNTASFPVISTFNTLKRFESNTALL